MPQNSKLRILTELAGAISIVLSLVFVGMELRQANDLAEAEGLQSLNEMLADLLTARMTDAELNSLIDKVEQGIELDEARGFTSAQKSRVRIYLSVWMTYGEASWKYTERGITSSDQYQDTLFIFCRVFSSSPTSADIWHSFEGRVADEFIADVEQNCPALQNSE